MFLGVLNLIITGIPSILRFYKKGEKMLNKSFKPYYNWNTFNTVLEDLVSIIKAVLNLIITGIPSILQLYHTWNISKATSFKPYYNWNTFNT